MERKVIFYKMTLKQKILKTIFYISFIPYLWVIIQFIFTLLYGVPFIADIVIEGKYALILYLLHFFSYLPVLTICLIYQIIFKIKTKDKPEYKYYNTKKFILVTCVLFILSITIDFSINYVTNTYEENAYHKIGYSEPNIKIVSYNEEYIDNLDSVKKVHNKELIEFFNEHSTDFNDYIKKYEKYHTSYVIITSPIIEGHLNSYETPYIEVSDGQQKSKVTIKYDMTTASDEKNIIICIIDSVPYDDNIEIIWEKNLEK